VAIKIQYFAAVVLLFNYTSFYIFYYLSAISVTVPIKKTDKH